MNEYIATIVILHTANALVGMVTDETLWDRLSSMACLLLALWGAYLLMKGGEL
jgi:hypothetical protein